MLDVDAGGAVCTNQKPAFSGWHHAQLALEKVQLSCSVQRDWGFTPPKVLALPYCTVVQPWTWTKLGKVSCVLRQREIDGILFELVRECFGVAPVCVHWLPPTEVAGE